MNPADSNRVPRYAKAARAALNRRTLFEAIAGGRVGTEMPAWDKVLTRQEIANVAEYVHAAFIRPGTR